jgi:hypothetical protein
MASDIDVNVNADSLSAGTMNGDSLPFACDDRFATIAVDADVGVRGAERGSARKRSLRGLGADGIDGRPS